MEQIEKERQEMERERGEMEAKWSKQELELGLIKQVGR